MRISGLSNLYGYTNTAAMRRYNSIRSTAGTTRSTGMNRSTSISRSTGMNRSTSISRSTVGKSQGVYGNYKSNAVRAAAKADAVYESTKTSARNLRTHGQNLMAAGENSLLSQAEKTGNTGDVVKEVNSFVNEYNDMVKNMNTGGGTMNDLYAGQLKTSYSSHKEALAEVGITAAKDGSLLIDQEMLKKADVAALKRAFGTTESLVGDAAVKSIYVEANAVSEQTASQYARYGNYGGYGGYGAYGGYRPYSSYGNYSSLGSYLGIGGYGSGYNYSNMIGTLFNSLF